MMLYRMLTGTLPVDSFKRLSQCNPDLNTDWDQFIQKAIAMEKEARFVGAKEMLAALDQLKVSWGQRKEKVCEMPVEALLKKRGRKGLRNKLPSQSVKVRPRHARQMFEADSRWRPNE